MRQLEPDNQAQKSLDDTTVVRFNIDGGQATMVGHLFLQVRLTQCSALNGVLSELVS